MQSLLQDVYYGVRALAARPLHALLTIAVLALAIGANATVFSVFNGLFLRSLPFPDGDRLVAVYNTYPGLNLTVAGTSIPDYLDRRERAAALEDLSIYTSQTRTLETGEAPERISVTRASPSLFPTLQVTPALGRVFTVAEAEPGNDAVAVISHRLWTSRFGARPDVIGSDIRLDGAALTIIGVMPAGFGFPDRNVAVWTPFAFTAAQRSDSSRGQEFSSSVGRLRPGATIDTLNAELDRIVQENLDLGRMQQTREGIAATGFTGRARTLRDMRVGDAKQGLLLLQGIVLAVLLMACANVTNFQLARMESRRRELSVRRALGASLARLARLVVAESFLLALAGGLAGIGLAYVGLDLVRVLGLDATIAGFDYVVDSNVLWFTLASVGVAALVSVILPLSVLLRDDFARAVAEAARPARGSLAAAGMRGMLIVVQIAVSAALLVTGGMLLTSFERIQSAGAGFSVDNVWSGTVAFSAARYPTTEAAAQFVGAALGELAALPGVAAAAFTSNLPLGSPNSQGSYEIEALDLPAGAPQPHAQQRAVSPDFFRVLDIPLIAGRGFAETETESVVIVDELFVARYFPGGNVLGRRIREDFGPDDPWYTVIGVVPAVKHSDLAETPEKETIYWHYRQNPPPFGAFVLRSAVPPEQLTRLVTSTLLRMDPLMPVSDVQTMSARVTASLGPQRAPVVLVLVFAASALVLAMIGIYGILTWAVSHRVGEIGVRMALGARAADIARMVLRQGGRLVAIGLAVGLVVAAGLGRIVAAQVRNIDAFDPVLFIVVAFALAGAALVASWLPARRAARIDPMAALREE